MRNHRAFTLPEVLVAATLSLLVLGLTATLLVPSLRICMRGHALADMQQEAMGALCTLQQDVQRCAPASVSLLQDAEHVVLAADRLADVDQNGNPDWIGAQVLYVWSAHEGTLLRKSWKAPSDADPTLPLQLDGAALEALGRNASLPSQRIASGVIAFRVDNAGAVTHGGAIDISLTLLCRTPRPEPFQCRCSVTCRNANQ